MKATPYLQMNIACRLLVDLYSMCDSYTAGTDAVSFSYSARNEFRVLFEGTCRLDRWREDADAIHFPYSIQTTIVDAYVVTVLFPRFWKLFHAFAEQLKISQKCEEERRKAISRPVQK